MNAADPFQDPVVISYENQLQKTIIQTGFGEGGILHESLFQRKKFSEAIQIQEFTLDALARLPRISSTGLSVLKKRFQLEKVISIDSVYLQLHLRGFILFKSSGCEIKHLDSLKLFTSIVGQYLHRLLIEERLQKSQHQFQEVVETQIDILCRFLPDTILTFVNRAYCQMFQQSAADLSEQSFSISFLLKNNSKSYPMSRVSPGKTPCCFII